MKSFYSIIYLPIILILSVNLLVGCTNSSFSSGMESLASSLEGFSERVRSQNSLVNASRVDASGSHQFGQISIATSTPQVLSPTQLADARSSVQIKYLQAHDAGVIPERTKWAKVSGEFNDQFSTLNEVIVFKIENRSQDDIDASGAKVLFMTSNGARLDHAQFSENALELLNDDAFLLDRESSQRITYINGKFGIIPALSTRYYGVIVPHMKAGQYQASVSSFPSAKGKLKFDLAKR